MKPSQSQITVQILSPDSFTAQEVVVLKLLCQGMTRKEIARVRHRSYGTVSRQVSDIADKLGAHSHAEIVAQAVARGVVSIGMRVAVLLLAALGAMSMAGTLQPPVVVEAVWRVLNFTGATPGETL